MLTKKIITVLALAPKSRRVLTKILLDVFGSKEGSRGILMERRVREGNDFN